MSLMSQPTNFNVLITSLSKKIPLIREVRNALVRINPDSTVIGADIDANCLGRYFVDEFWRMSPLNDLSGDDVVRFCQDNHIRAIIPTRDGELEFYARNREILETAGVLVMIPSLNSVRACIDKRVFYDALRDKTGLNVIPVYDGPDHSPRTRWVVKERFGSGSSNVCFGLTCD
jgi:carbamoyl-phosphate synthase large subunit